MQGIYKITNLINNKSYIGSSIDIERRWRQHKEASINQNDHHYNYPLMQAFRDYGINNFSFKIIEEVQNIQDMIDLEHKYILLYDTKVPNGYNQTDKTNSPMFDNTVSQKVSNTKRKKYGKQVVEIDSNNIIINQWESLVEAAEETGLNRYKISNVCNGLRLTTGNRRFRFLDINQNIVEPEYLRDKIISHRTTINNKKVAQYNLTNELIQIFDSISLAADKTKCDGSRISAVCRGKRKTTGGYIWRYVNE